MSKIQEIKNSKLRISRPYKQKVINKYKPWLGWLTQTLDNIPIPDGRGQSKNVTMFLMIQVGNDDKLFGPSITESLIKRVELTWQSRLSDENFLKNLKYTLDNKNRSQQVN